jgi:hypothetical protein
MIWRRSGRQTQKSGALGNSPGIHRLPCPIQKTREVHLPAILKQVSYPGHNPTATVPSRPDQKGGRRVPATGAIRRAGLHRHSVTAGDRNRDGNWIWPRAAVAPRRTTRLFQIRSRQTSKLANV